MQPPDNQQPNPRPEIEALFALLRELAKHHRRLEVLIRAISRTKTMYELAVEHQAGRGEAPDLDEQAATLDTFITSARGIVVSVPKEGPKT